MTALYPNVNGSDNLVHMSCLLQGLHLWFITTCVGTASTHLKRNETRAPPFPPPRALHDGPVRQKLTPETKTTLSHRPVSYDKLLLSSIDTHMDVRCNPNCPRTIAVSYPERPC